jgi:hypothetical protein
LEAGLSHALIFGLIFGGIACLHHLLWYSSHFARCGPPTAQAVR